MRYIIKITTPFGVKYYGTHNDKIRNLTKERIARMGYKTKEKAMENWFFVNFPIQYTGATSEIIEYEI